MAEWQEQLVNPSFRGVPFLCTDTSNEFGRRLVVHEYPQHDVPYAEDLGRKGRKFTISAYVIGTDWEKQRDKLIQACEKPGPGVLIHPDLGTWKVACESCHVTESKVNAALMASFQLSFVETGVNKFPTVKVNSVAKLQNQAQNSTLNLAKIFAGLYQLAQLPQYAVDYAMGLMTELTGISSPYSILNAANAIKDIVNSNFTLPWQIPVLTSAFTSAFNLNYSSFGSALVLSTSPSNTSSLLAATDTPSYTIASSDIDTQTNAINASDALQIYLDICSVQINHLAATSPISTLQWESGKRLELLTKGFAIAEAVVACSQIDYQSIEEAQQIWTTVTNAFDNLISIAVELNDDKSFIELRNLKAAFRQDIQARAPGLAHLIYRPYEDPTPSLVIAYDLYEDITRDDEIVLRNHIQHPGFVLNPKLELLSE